MEGRIKKRKIKLHTYMVSYTSPLSGKEEKKWVSLHDITSPIPKRKNRNKNTPSCLKRKKLTTTTSIYYMPARRDDYAKAIEDHGFGLQSSRRWELAIGNLLHYRTSQRD